MEEVLIFVMQLVVGSGGAFYVVWRDDRTLTPEQEYRAWPASSRLSAVAGFGPLCLPIHFWRTRRSARGLAMGVGYMILVNAVVVLLGLLIEFVYTRW